MQKESSNNKKRNLEERKVTDWAFLRIAFPIATIGSIIMALIYNYIAPFFGQPSYSYINIIKWGIIISIVVFVTLPLREALNKIIDKKIIHKYGISKFTIASIIIVILIVTAAVVTPIFTDEAPLSIAQVVSVILFGIFVMFILKVFKND